MPLDSTFPRWVSLVSIALLGLVSLVATPAEAAQAANETPIFSFGGVANDATGPAYLVFGSGGALYGIGEGGSQATGAFFSYNPTTGVETLLYSLPANSSSTDEPPPDSPDGLVQAGDGNLYATTFYGGANDLGAIFEYNVKTATGSIVHSFSISTTDGVRPESPIVGADGNLYGVTLYGGATGGGGASGSGEGAIFKYDVTSGQESLVYSFGATSPATDAAFPNSLILGSDGNLYGLAGGGVNSQGALFEYNLTAAQESVLSAFGQSTTDGTSPAFLLQAKNGNFYGTTFNGGADAISGTTVGSGTLFEYSPSTATRTTLLSFATSPGFSPTQLIQGTDGNLYGVGDGGANGVGTFLEYNLSTGTPGVLASFGSSSSDARNPLQVLQASNGNFYGSAAGGGHGEGAIFEVTAASSTASGGGSSGGGSSGGGGAVAWVDLVGLGVAAMVRRRKAAESAAGRQKGSRLRS